MGNRVGELVRIAQFGLWVHLQTPGLQPEFHRFRDTGHAPAEDVIADHVYFCFCLPGRFSWETADG